MTDRKMTNREMLEFEKTFRRDQAAARLRITLDQKLGRETPDSVTKLANIDFPTVVPEDPVEYTNFIRAQILRARLQVTVDRKLGRETPEAVITLSETELPDPID